MLPDAQVLCQDLTAQLPLEPHRATPESRTPEVPEPSDRPDPDQAPARPTDRFTDLRQTSQSAPIEPQRAPEPPAGDATAAGCDMRAIMSADVSETVRRQALRAWFHLPGFNQRDGLDDYDGDYRQFNPLGDVLTAHLRHQMQRLAHDPAQPSGHTAATACPAVKARPARKPAGEKGACCCSPSAAMRQNPPHRVANPAADLLWHAQDCARNSAARPACTRCRDACANAAISFDAAGLKIHPERCSGQGTCAVVCPTGALRPAADDTARMLGQIRSAAQAGGQVVCAVFSSARTTDETLHGLAVRFPESVLALRSRYPAGPGAEAWLAALAMGASRVIVLGEMPPAVRQEQLALARAILAGLDPEAPARLLDGAEAIPQRPSGSPINRWPPLAVLSAAAWEPAAAKRDLLWQAVDDLHGRMAGACAGIALPDGAPFGEILLEPSRCTLCMACAGACPTGALRTGSDRPEVRFRERDCIQCGLCRQTCPERALSLNPRICFDRAQTSGDRVLHQAEPLTCSGCGAPFAAPDIVAAVTRKLSAHWMYQDPSTRELLTMCRDCRIRRLYARRQAPPGRDGSRRVE